MHVRAARFALQVERWSCMDQLRTTLAVKSARRHRGRPVNSDTLEHWADVLIHARQALTQGSGEPIQALIVELDDEIAARLFAR